MTNLEPFEWSNSDVDLLLELRRGHGLRDGIEAGLRDAIRSGRLAAGTRLPASRALARDLGISRGTVVQAYGQLTAEGWITSRRGSGTVVAADAASEAPPGALREPQPTRWRFDLRPGRPDVTSFPRAAWLRALRQTLASAPSASLDYAAQGQPVLRGELAGYLSRARGLRADAPQIVVTSGFTQGLGLLARALAAKGVRRVAIEEPSMRLHRDVL